MPTFKCVSAATVDYVMDGPEAPTVAGRPFEPGECVAAASNPDPDNFVEVATEGADN